MLTVRIHEDAGPIGNLDIEWIAQSAEYDVLTATESAYVIAGVAQSDAFQGQRLVVEMLGSFRYAEGPDPEPSPYGGRVSEWTLYASNRKVASFAFDEPIRFDNFYDRVDWWTDRGMEVIGNDYGNWLDGGTGPDTLRGRGGDDLLIGYARDALFGGEGDDIYSVQEDSVVVAERRDAGLDTVEAFTSYRLPANVENLALFSFDGLLVGEGNRLDNGLAGGFSDDLLSGRAGDDLIRGFWGDDGLFGGQGGDSLRGGPGADRLAGGIGADLLFGGVGTDVFRFGSAEEAGIGGRRDRVLDFESGVDRLALRAIDADVGRDGDQAFDWIGAQGFTGTAGELRFGGSVLAGDTDGDGTAEFQIAFTNGVALAAGDIIA